MQKFNTFRKIQAQRPRQPARNQIKSAIIQQKDKEPPEPMLPRRFRTADGAAFIMQDGRAFAVRS